MQTYKDLRVYVLAVISEARIIEITQKFPRERRYSLAEQLRRSSQSMIAYMAEGFGRKVYPQEFLNYLIISQASCNESRRYLHSALNRGYCSKEDFSEIDDHLDHIGQMLTLLMRNIRFHKYSN